MEKSEKFEWTETYFGVPEDGLRVAPKKESQMFKNPVEVDSIRRIINSSLKNEAVSEEKENDDFGASTNWKYWLKKCKFEKNYI